MIVQSALFLLATAFVLWGLWKCDGLVELRLDGRVLFLMWCFCVFVICAAVAVAIGRGS